MNLLINISRSQLYRVLGVLRKAFFDVGVVVNVKKEGAQDGRHNFTLDDIPLVNTEESFSSRVARHESILSVRRYEMEKRGNHLTAGLILAAIGLALFMTMQVRNFFSEIDVLVAFILTLAAFMTLFIGIALTIAHFIGSIAHFIGRKREQK